MIVKILSAFCLLFENHVAHVLYNKMEFENVVFKGGRKNCGSEEKILKARTKTGFKLNKR